MLSIKRFFCVFLAAVAIFCTVSELAQASKAKPQPEKTRSASASFDLTGKKILFVITSADKLGTSKMKSGYWLEELAAPYEILSQAGAEITLASPKGGLPPVDAFSLRNRFLTSYTKSFKKDGKAQSALKTTLPLAKVKAQDFDALYYPAGFGIFTDLLDNPDSIHLIESFSRARKPIAFISHAPAVLKNVKDARGQALVKGVNVTALRNSEEAGSAMLRSYAWLVPPGVETAGNGVTYKRAELPEQEFLKAMDLKDKIPFLVENMLKRKGANFQAQPNMSSFTVSDATADGGILLTAQNPYSSAEIAEKLAGILVALPTPQG